MKFNKDLLRKLAGAALFFAMGVMMLTRPGNWNFKAFYWLALFRVFVVAGLFLYRAPAKRLSGAPMQAIAIISTFLPLLFSAEGSDPLIPEDYFTYAWVLCMAGTALGIWGFIALGKSFGMSPALRERVTRGPYRLMKHPIYVGHVASDLGFILMAMSPRNLAVFGLNLALLIVRARVETTMLESDAHGLSNS